VSEREARHLALSEWLVLCMTVPEPTGSPCCWPSRCNSPPIAAALGDRVRDTAGFDHTLAVWRHQAMDATMRFLTTMTSLD
jgi:hypothetical protein